MWIFYLKRRISLLATCYPTAFPLQFLSFSVKLALYKNMNWYSWKKCTPTSVKKCAPPKKWISIDDRITGFNRASSMYVISLLMFLPPIFFHEATYLLLSFVRSMVKEVFDIFVILSSVLTNHFFMTLSLCDIVLEKFSFSRSGCL